MPQIVSLLKRDGVDVITVETGEDGLKRLYLHNTVTGEKERVTKKTVISIMEGIIVKAQPMR
jgi:hypothetical protein